MLLFNIILSSFLFLLTSTASTSPPRSNNGLTTAVEWDKYSFFVLGKRVFIQSGEFHTWRLPVPDLWRDIVQKAKAAGLTTLSIYVHWGINNPKSGVVDMSGINDLQPFFDAAKEAGLWVIARPGPYINSETTTGGVPGHVVSIPGNPVWNPYNGELRSNDTFYHDAWQDYWTAVIGVIAKNQVSKGGPVILLQIENEYYNGPGQNEYVLELKERAIELGIVIPTIVNDSGEFRNLLNDTDIYGLDAYPNSLNCASPTVWRNAPTNWRSYHESIAPDKPFLFPEFQGGANDVWGSTGGYAACRELTNPNFQRVYYHHLWANGVTAESFYMFYGGTSWGQLPFSNGYTSYDYGASVNETRELTAKFSELKLQSMFLRSFHDLRMTDLVGEDNTTVSGVTATHLMNPESGASFWIVRHTDTTINNTLTFQLPNISSSGVTVPQLGRNMTLLGRDSFLITTDLSFGSASKLQYSTAQLFTTLNIGGNDAIVIYGTSGLVYEAAFVIPGDVKVEVQGSTVVTSATRNGTLVINFAIAPGLTTLTLQSASSSKNIVVLIADYDTATRFWMPTLAGKGAFSNHIDVSATSPLLILGPYLIRTASLNGNTLTLTGDLDEASALTLWAPMTNLKTLTWNGKKVNGFGSLSNSLPGSYQATIGHSLPSISLPDLMSANWKFADSLPEIGTEFDDSEMTPADHTTTTSVFPPYYGAPWILYADDYGFHAGNLVWRGTFNHDSTLAVPSAVNLSISGANNFAASVWLNGAFLGSTDTRRPTTNTSFVVPAAFVVQGENKVVVLQDHMGGNLAGQVVCCTPGGRQRDLQQPRGIQGYFLVGRAATVEEQFTSWKLAGNFKGESAPDSTRKILNEGGLFGERAGWHLPGFDDSQWENRTPFQGLDKPGVGFFRTSFNLSLPAGFDVPLTFAFDGAVGQYRAQLYVNGWQMGKRIANIGPQTDFPVHEGILDYHGENTVVVSLWGIGTNASDLKIPSLRLVKAGGIYASSVGKIKTDNPGWAVLRG